MNEPGEPEQRTEKEYKIPVPKRNTGRGSWTRLRRRSARTASLPTPRSRSGDSPPRCSYRVGRTGKYSVPFPFDGGNVSPLETAISLPPFVGFQMPDCGHLSPVCGALLIGYVPSGSAPGSAAFCQVGSRCLGLAFDRGSPIVQIPRRDIARARGPSPEIHPFPSIAFYPSQGNLRRERRTCQVQGTNLPARTIDPC